MVPLGRLHHSITKIHVKEVETDKNVFLVIPHNARISPRCVTVVCQRHVASSQLIEHPQGTQTAVNGVASLHADQTADFTSVKSVLYACGKM